MGARHSLWAGVARWRCLALTLLQSTARALLCHLAPCRPWDALSIQRLPDTREKEWECLRHFGWLLDKHKPAVLVALGRRGRAKQETQPQQR